MDRLAYIIADMLKSALAWEEEHGIPEPKTGKTSPNKTLTNNRQAYNVERTIIPTKTETNEDEEDCK